MPPKIYDSDPTDCVLDEISKMKENLEAVTNEALVLSKEANELRCTVEEKTRKKHEIMKVVKLCNIHSKSHYVLQPCRNFHLRYRW